MSMTPEHFHSRFPCLCEILKGTKLDTDLESVTLFARDGEESLRQALEQGIFDLNGLMALMAGAIAPTLLYPGGLSLENGLSAVFTSVGLDVARGAYRKKLLVDHHDKLEDTCYEIAVTARACAVLDAGSIQLEKPVPDAEKHERDWKNSDIFGTFGGEPVRIDVTVLHERLPDAVHLDLDEIVRAAPTVCGFAVSLRTHLRDEAHAERVRTIIELLEESHRDSGGAHVEIDGVRFRWGGGTYHCNQETSPFKSIVFYNADEFPGAESLREITHPCSVRSVTPGYISEDYPNPPGVVTLADSPDAPSDVPVSTKIRQILQNKLRQCEPGVINIIALGIPLPIHDREVEDALYGPRVVGFRAGGKGVLLRAPKAPFAPAQCLECDDDRNEFIEPFRKLSAVCRIRIATQPRIDCFSNPNAARPAPAELLAALLSQDDFTHAVGQRRTPPDDTPRHNG